MATVKIKFRPSTVEGAQGTLFYQVIHNRIVRQHKTDYRLYSDEWNVNLSEVIPSRTQGNRMEYVMEIGESVKRDVERFHQIIASLDYRMVVYTADDVITAFEGNRYEVFFFSFMESVIANLKALGKIRTSETYASTLNSFKRFRKNRDLTMDTIDSDMIRAYEAYLKNNGVSLNSSSFYMRNLRAVYNRAVEKDLIIQRYPFRHVYTGVDKTAKRAVPLTIIRKMKEMDLAMSPALDLARDMFLFSFYTRGMSFVDMAYLRKRDLKGGILTYRRRKTGQLLFIKWEKCMQMIVEKYEGIHSNYLLPIIKPFSEVDERKQYLYAAHCINRSLKIIGCRLNLSIPLTMYVSRHSWASIAKNKQIPISVISEGMGHDSEATTRIYLASLDTVAVDKANHIILKSL